MAAEYTCLQCGYAWNRRDKRNKEKFRPKSCPECKRRDWDRPYKEDKK